MAEDGEWLMATGAERALIDRLARTCLRLDDPAVTSGITVGIQTSADDIYHLKRLGPGRYLCAPKGVPAYEVAIEDALMKPLVSGAEAKRYEEPETETYLLFPYEREAGGAMRLIAADRMAVRYPLGWTYLKTWEAKLRARENGSFDDPEWYRFGRHQNLDKQDREKLIVPRIVASLKCSIDQGGRYYLDNVDVGGVIVAKGSEPAYIAAVLNGPVATFIFRLIAKPFRGDYRSANKQFIAPLPIPRASAGEQADIAARARDLQARWTDRRALIEAAEARLAVLARSRRDERWLWPDLPDIAGLTERAPKGLKAKGDRLDWAKRQFEELVAARVASLQAALDGGMDLSAEFRRGELRLYAGGALVLGSIFLDDEAGSLAEAYWRWLMLARERRDAAAFAADLRRPPSEATTPAAQQFIERVEALAAQTAAIAAAERDMNEALYRLYDLTADERLLVERAAT